MIEFNDNELVKRTLQGNEDAFLEIFDRYQKTLFNIIYRMVNNHDDAEEVTQRVFIKVYDSLSRFKPELKFFSWMYRIALNETLNFLKQKRNFDELSTELISKDKDPDEEFTSIETKEKIRQALMDIEPDYRALIILKHIDGRSYDEIAEIVGIPEKKVKSRLYTARHKLKDALINLGMLDNE